MIIEEIMFSKEECDSIIKLEKTNYTDWKFRKDRKYVSQSISHNNSTDWIFNKLVLFFEKSTDINVLNLKKEIHYHKYGPGDWFSKHSDNINKRLYSVGVLLNEDYVGGDFVIYENEEKIKLNKKTGNTYIFNSELSHEIEFISDGYRHSLIYFLESENIKIPLTNLI